MAATASLSLLALLCLALPLPAFAGPPVHPALPDPTGGFSLNHACGTAVDSEGDIYVADAGDAKVEVFDSSGSHLISVANSNEPCALAVDTNGRLYVSEKSTGKVVRYTPTVYPFTGAPSYGVAEPIDSSGSANGIAVDSSDDSLYVAEGNQVAIYKSDGTLFTGDEVQLLEFPGSPSGGTYTLEFEGSTTSPIPYNAPATGPGSIQEALEGLPTIGSGNVTVDGGGERITFVGALAATNVSSLVVDDSGLVGSTAQITVGLQGFNGHLGEGELSNATGVTSYTYDAAAASDSARYISVADVGTGKIDVFTDRFETTLPHSFQPGALALRREVDGSETPAGVLGLAAAGAYLGADQKTGHIYAYDAVHNVVNEFEATGQYFTRIVNPEFEDAGPTAISVDRSSGASDGRVYVTAGPGSGAKLLAFGPVDSPSRKTLGEPPAHHFNNACGTVVDSAGDVYLAGESTIKVYGPAGNELTSIVDTARPCFLAVDSKGTLYAANRGTNSSGDEKVVCYRPQAYPPQSGTNYTECSTPIETLTEPRGIAVNPQNDHLFVTHLGAPVIEYSSFDEGSILLVSKFCGIGEGAFGIDVYGAEESVYIVRSTAIVVCNPDGTKVLRSIDGTGSPGGPFSGLSGVSIAVDQSNGHVLVGEMTSRGVVEEFEASGSFVGQFGEFLKVVLLSDVALDNSFGASKGNLYVAYRNELTAFGRLAYGAVPEVAAGIATGVGGETATLNGTVNPNGFPVTECKFEYVSQAAFESTGFTDLSSGGSKPCVPNPTGIGEGNAPVEVHATTDTLGEPQGRYHFRLLARNKIGENEHNGQDEGLFGPPVIVTQPPKPLLYREAILRANLDSSGLPTEYYFEYGPTEAYGQRTPVETLGAGAGPTDIEVALTGLDEGQRYHFRLVAENEDATVSGPDQELTTLNKPPVLSCPNQTLRLENGSTHLPDCRAYELVTPADTRGLTPYAEQAAFNDWMVTPSGPLAGESLAFFIQGTLPGTESSGLRDAFRATRGSAGWSTSLFSPSYIQKGDGSTDSSIGVASDQRYSLWRFGSTTPAGAFAPGAYLRAPGGFEAVGQGDLGVDLNANADFVSAGGSHVLFSSTQQLENEPGNEAPSLGTAAIYDRTAGSSHATVISVKPDGSPFVASATYVGSNESGSAVLFRVGGDLYLHREGAPTLEVTASPNSFAGISEDGSRVFYTDSVSPKEAAGLWVFDAETKITSQIFPNAKFVNVSADGSRVYFSTAGSLYAWDGVGATLIAPLASEDLHQAGKLRFPETGKFDAVALDSWAADCETPGPLTGRAACPSRTSSDGRFLVFQSHADLTPPYEGEGHSEIYRYDAEEETLLCVSCDPSGAPASADADLQGFGPPSFPTLGTTMVPGVTSDGGEVVFQTQAALLPEDANTVTDVYEWMAQGKGGCERPEGCLGLISSGQSDNPSFVYSMTPDGHDVFFSTLEKLVRSDVVGSPSIYDARVEGGFPSPPPAEPCHGDSCQPEPGAPPAQPRVRSDVPNAGNAKKPGKRCPKGRRTVRKAGKVHCVKRHHKKHGRAKAKRSAGR